MEIDRSYFEKQTLKDLRDIFANIDDYTHRNRALIVLELIAERTGKEIIELTFEDVLGYIPEQNSTVESPLDVVFNPIITISSILWEEAFSEQNIRENETYWRFKRLIKHQVMNANV